MRSAGGIPLGYEWNPKTGRYGKRVVFEGTRAPHCLLFGPNGAGKDTSIVIPALLDDLLKGTSVIAIDTKGEGAAVTAAWRRQVGELVMINPFGLLVDRYPDLASAGFNPVATLDPASPTFYDDAKGLGEALIVVEGDHQKHFPESARGVVTAAIMHARKKFGRAASLKDVRLMLTDLRAAAEEMRDAGQTFPDRGGWQIASLAERFAHEFTNELSGIQSTAATQTEWIMSEPMAGDLATNGVDFGRLKQKVGTVFLVLPAERLRTHAVWLRLVITSALQALYSTPGPVKVLLIVNEAAQLGRLGPIEDALGQARGYGVSLWPVFQDINQLRDLYKSRAETFAGMSGAIFGFTPNDMNTAEWMSKRSGENTALGMSASEAAAGDLRGPHVNVHPETRPVYAPHDLFNLPPGHGLVWLAGRTRPVPVATPPYWEIKTIAKRARPNPYAPKNARQPGQRIPGLGLIAGTAMLGALALLTQHMPGLKLSGSGATGVAAAIVRAVMLDAHSASHSSLGGQPRATR